MLSKLTISANLLNRYYNVSITTEYTSMTYNDGFVFAMLKETNSNAMMVKINYSTGVVAARYHMNNVMENLLIRFEDSEVLQAYYGDDSAFHQMKYNLTQPTWA